MRPYAHPEQKKKPRGATVCDGERWISTQRVAFTSFPLIKRTSADAASQAFIRQEERNLQGVIDLLYFDGGASE